MVATCRAGGWELCGRVAAGELFGLARPQCTGRQQCLARWRGAGRVGVCATQRPPPTRHLSPMALANPTSLMGGCGAAHGQDASAARERRPSGGGGMAAWRRRRRQGGDACSGGARGTQLRMTAATAAAAAGRLRLARMQPARSARAVGGPTCWPGRVLRFLKFRAWQASERRNHSNAIAHGSLEGCRGRVCRRRRSRPHGGRLRGARTARQLQWRAAPAARAQNAHLGGHSTCQSAAAAAACHSAPPPAAWRRAASAPQAPRWTPGS
jgi:hypothetical protein